MNSEAKSAKSEDKNTRGQGKYINSTNPTSETSSIKDSSITSNQEFKGFNSDSKMKNEQRHDEKDGVLLSKLNQKNKAPTSKYSKPLKSDRPKYM